MYVCLHIHTYGHLYAVFLCIYWTKIWMYQFQFCFFSAWKNKIDDLKQGLIESFPVGPDVGTQEPQHVCCNYPAVLWLCQSSHRQRLHRWMWMCLQESLTKIGGQDLVNAVNKTKIVGRYLEFKMYLKLSGGRYCCTVSPKRVAVFTSHLTSLTFPVFWLCVCVCRGSGGFIWIDIFCSFNLFWVSFVPVLCL